MARRTRRTNTEISTFIQAWLDSATTREVATLLARRRKDCCLLYTSDAADE